MNKNNLVKLRKPQALKAVGLLKETLRVISKEAKTFKVSSEDDPIEEVGGLLYYVLFEFDRLQRKLQNIIYDKL